MRFFIQLILLTFILTSCMEQEDVKMRELNIHISFEDDLDISIVDGAEVQLKNINNGRIYTQIVSQGVVKYNIEYGIYNASLSIEIDKSNYNAFLNDIKIGDKQDSDNKLILHCGVYSPIIIKEIYYSGVNTEKGKSYFSDQFVEIYNNSNEMYNISGLCIAEIYGNTSSVSNWQDDNHDLLPYLPISKMIWSIPYVAGGDFLAPGEARVIAQTAINHSDPNLSLSSVNLENADFETFLEYADKDYDNTNVENLDLVYPNNCRYGDWFINPNGPAVILFNIPGDIADFVGDENNVHVRPHSTFETICIPKEYVIDAVECVISKTSNFKRLHIELDASYIYVSMIRKGYSVRRRVKDIIDGRVVYMDTNDSARDFLTDQVPMPGRNPLIIETK